MSALDDQQQRPVVSVVYYVKRGSLQDANDPDAQWTIRFIGRCIPLIQFKQRVVFYNGWMKSPSECTFDLEVCNQETGEQFRDDQQMIRANLVVTVRRVGAATMQQSQKLYLPPGTLTDVNNVLVPETTAAYRAQQQAQKPIGFMRRPGNATLVVTSGVTTSTIAPHLLPGGAPTALAASGRRTLPSERGGDRQADSAGGRFQDFSRAPPGSVPPAFYTCHRCHEKGHFKQWCPLGNEHSQSTTSSSFRSERRTRPSLDEEEDERPNRRQRYPSQSNGNNSSRWLQPVEDRTAQRGIPSRQVDQQQQQTELNRSQLTCPMCQQLYHKAQVLLCCYATLCESCVFLSQRHEPGECPVCHTQGDLFRFQDNKQLQQVVDASR